VTRAELEKIKAKPHGPDVDALIKEIEDCWKEIRSCWDDDCRDLPPGEFGN